jgi:DNA-binding PadR family transcriptional regulator
MPDSQINPTAAALLGLLHEGPMTGGQLMAAAERRLGPYWSMTRSQVYRELPVLAEMGFVRLGKPGPRSSQPYAITASQLQTLYASANEYHAEAMAMAKEQAKEAKKSGDAYGAAALEFAVAYHKAALSWLKIAPST